MKENKRKEILSVYESRNVSLLFSIIAALVGTSGYK
jgi:hypothetical protein